MAASLSRWLTHPRIWFFTPMIRFEIASTLSFPSALRPNTSRPYLLKGRVEEDFQDLNAYNRGWLHLQGINSGKSRRIR